MATMMMKEHLCEEPIKFSQLPRIDGTKPIFVVWQISLEHVSQISYEFVRKYCECCGKYLKFCEKYLEDGNMK